MLIAVTARPAICSILVPTIFVVLSVRHMHVNSVVPARRKPSLTSVDAIILVTMYVITLTILVGAESST